GQQFHRKQAEKTIGNDQHMRVTVLSERSNVLGQHAADFLKIILPVAAEIFWKVGDEALQCIHFSSGRMRLRNSGAVARDPDGGHAIGTGPEFNQRGLRTESRLNGTQCERVRRKLCAKKSVLKNASAAALHEL